MPPVDVRVCSWNMHGDLVRPGYRRFAFLRSGRPGGPGKTLKNVGGEAPHLVEGLSGPPGPARPQKCTPKHPARLPSGTQEYVCFMRAATQTSRLTPPAGLPSPNTPSNNAPISIPPTTPQRNSSAELQGPGKLLRFRSEIDNLEPKSAQNWRKPNPNCPVRCPHSGTNRFRSISDRFRGVPTTIRNF